MLTLSPFRSLLNPQARSLPSPHACSAAGYLLFQSRRWLDPRILEDRDLLIRNHDALCAAFPSFAACPRDTFLLHNANVAAS